MGGGGSSYNGPSGPPDEQFKTPVDQGITIDPWRSLVSFVLPQVMGYRDQVRPVNENPDVNWTEIAANAKGWDGFDYLKDSLSDEDKALLGDWSPFGDNVAPSPLSQSDEDGDGSGKPRMFPFNPAGRGDLPGFLHFFTGGSGGRSEKETEYWNQDAIDKFLSVTDQERQDYITAAAKGDTEARNKVMERWVSNVDYKANLLDPYEVAEKNRLIQDRGGKGMAPQTYDADQQRAIKNSDAHWRNLMDTEGKSASDAAREAWIKKRMEDYLAELKKPKPVEKKSSGKKYEGFDQWEGDNMGGSYGGFGSDQGIGSFGGDYDDSGDW